MSDARVFTLGDANGILVRVTNYGATLLAIDAPDRDGNRGNVILSYDSLDWYERDDRSYLGALCGRFANRIAFGRFTLDGVTYQLSVNDPPHHLHGGFSGFNRKLFDVGEATPDKLRLRHVSPDGDEGYPGTLQLDVTLAVEGNAFRIDYDATASEATPVNITHHPYFNLSAGAEENVLGHELTIRAAQFTPIDETQIPTGEYSDVADTPFDFRAPRQLKAHINDDDPQLRIARGYDHNFVLDGSRGALTKAAQLVHHPSGRMVEIETTAPGLQLYTGNLLDTQRLTSAGRTFAPNAGVALECQQFPDAPNHPDFPSSIVRPGTAWRSTTVYRFGVIGRA